jgi:uncharacterized membrane protein YuzA (DUF378 family)
MRIVNPVHAAVEIPEKCIGKNCAPTLQGLETVFSNVIFKVIGLAGIVFFIMLILGGFKYITAGDEPPKAEAAKKTLTAAVIGLVFIALAFLILKIIETFTGAPVTEFKIVQ